MKELDIQDGSLVGGKYDGYVLDAVPESYLYWLATSKRNTGVSDALRFEAAGKLGINERWQRTAASKRLGKIRKAKKRKGRRTSGR